jgi:hypothetical protein
MKNLRILMLMMGLAVISACASNEVNKDTDESSAEMTNEQMQTEAAVEAAEVEAAVETEEVIEAVETEAMTEAEVEAGDTGNLVSTCNYGDQVRIITVVYDNEETGKACEVNYEKSTGVQTLWSANTDKDYCMEQAVEFVKKQEGWGWVCSELE